MSLLTWLYTQRHCHAGKEKDLPQTVAKISQCCLILFLSCGSTLLLETHELNNLEGCLHTLGHVDKCLAIGYIQ